MCSNAICARFRHMCVWPRRDSSYAVLYNPVLYYAGPVIDWGVRCLWRILWS